MSWVSEWVRNTFGKTVLNQLLINKLLEVARAQLDPYTQEQMNDFVEGMGNHPSHPMLFDVQHRGETYQAVGFLVPRKASAFGGQFKTFVGWVAANAEHVAKHSGPLQSGTVRSGV